MLKAKHYNNLAKQYYNVDLESNFHKYMGRKEERTGAFGVGEYNKIKYG